MKKLLSLRFKLKANCFSFLLILLVISIIQPVGTKFVSASSSTDKAMEFIENVLPIDASKYTITLRPDRIPDFPGKIADESTPSFDLVSKEGALRFYCIFEKDFLTICQMSVTNGSVETDKPYADDIDAAKSFLEKYQSYSNLDSTEMIKMFSKVEPAKNTTELRGLHKEVFNECQPAN